MSKFKIGDKVRYKNGPYSSLTRDNIYIVRENHSHVDDFLRLEKDDAGKPNGFDVKYFELVESSNEEYLQSLVKKANEGFEARNELHKLAQLRLEVRTAHVLGNVPNQFFGFTDTINGYHTEVRLKPLLPKEKKFTLQNYEVIITKDLVQIGCQKDFKFEVLKEQIHNLSIKGSKICSTGDWIATREGIYHTKACGSLSWENADTLLKELKDFDEKKSD